MTEERINCFLDSFDEGNGEWLDALEDRAIAERIPIIRRSMQGFLRFLLEEKRPEHILEVGTAVGFSALLMAQYTPASTTIHTIEKYGKRIKAARANFEKYDKDRRITLIEKDAAQALTELYNEGEHYDFIFMDAAKGQYMGFFEPVMKLLDTGGILLSDNVFFDGDIMESRYAVERRDRTIHSRMREYLRTITHDERLRTAILPMGDGVAVSVRKQSAKADCNESPQSRTGSPDQRSGAGRKQSAKADCNESPQSRTDLRFAPVGSEQTSTGRLSPPDQRSGAGRR